MLSKFYTTRNNSWRWRTWQPATAVLLSLLFVSTTHYASAENVAIGSTAGATSTDFGGSPGKAVDGDFSSGNWYHNAGGDANGRWWTDLGDDFSIHSIRTYRRQGFDNRITGLTLSLHSTTNGTGPALWSTTITSPDQFSIPDTAGLARSVALTGPSDNGTWINVSEVVVNAADSYFSGSGTWDNGSTTNWGTVTGGPYNTNTFGIYNIGQFEGTAGTVTIAGSGANVNGIRFTTDGYLIQGGNLTLGSPTGGTIIGVTNGNTATIASQIFNAGGNGLMLRKEGTGRLELTGEVRSDEKWIDVNGGTLAVTGNGSLYSGLYSGGNGIAVRNGATLELDNWQYNESANSTTSLGGLRNNANAIYLNDGTIRLNGIGDSSYDRGFTIQAGGGTLESAAGANWILESGGPAIDVQGNGSLTLTGAGDGTLNKVFSGGGALIKEGAGTWTISAGNQAFTGGLVINEGTVIPAAGDWFTSFFGNVSPRTITINNGGRLQQTGTHDLGGLNSSTSFYQPTIEVNTGGVWQLDQEQYLSANNLDLNGGTVRIGGGKDLRLQGGTVVVSATPGGSVIEPNTGGGSITLHGDATFQVADDAAAAVDLDVSTPINQNGGRTLTKTGDGDVRLSGDVNISTLSVINGGLELAANTVTLSESIRVGRSGAGNTLGNNLLTISSGTVTTPVLMLGEQDGQSGNVLQIGGTVNVTNNGNTNRSDDFRIGHWPNETSSYEISDGALNATDADVAVSWDGNGIFTQSGGDVTFENLYAGQAGRDGSGVITVSDGTLNVSNNLRVDGDNDSYTQTGGDVSVGTLSLKQGTIDISGGTLDANLISLEINGAGTAADNNLMTISGGTITTSRLFLGQEQPGNSAHVLQSGGIVNVTGGVDRDFRIGHWGSETSTYEITGGTINAPNVRLSVGWDGGGEFTQTGGDVIVRRLILDDSGTELPGTYTLTDGTLTIGDRGINTPIGGTFNNWGNQGRFDGGGGTLKASADFTIGNGLERFELTGVGGDLTIDTNGFDVTGNEGIIGSGGLIKAGLGTLTLPANNSYTGTTTVNAGTLLFNGDANSPPNGGIVVNDGGTLAVATNAYNGFDFNAPVTINAGGTMTANSTSNNAYNVGLVTLNGGNLTSGAGSDANAFGNWVIRDVTTGGTTPSLIDSATLGLASGTFTVADVTGDAFTDLTVTSQIRNGGIIKNGPGTMTLTTPSVSNSATTVNGGVLALNHAANTADGVIRGTVTVNDGATLRTEFANNLGWNGNRVTTLNLNGGTLDNVAAGDQGWGITINMTGGTMQSNGGVSEPDAPSYFSLGGGSSINTFASADSSTINGTIRIRESNAGNVLPFTVADGAAEHDLIVNAGIREQGLNTGRGLTKSGAGTMVLTGTNNYTGPTNVDAGTLLLNGTNNGNGLITVANGATLGGNGSAPVAPVLMQGTLSPGNSPDFIGPFASYVFAAGSDYDWELLDTTVGAGPGGWDRLNVNGAFTIDDLNDFSIDVTGLFSVHPDELGLAIHKDYTTGPFDIVSYGSTTLAPGPLLTFDVNEGNLSSYGYFTLINNDANNTLDLLFTATVPEPGTYAMLALLLLGGLCLHRRRRA